MTVSDRIIVSLSIWLSNYTPPVNINNQMLSIDVGNIKTVGDLFALLSFGYGETCQHIFMPNGDLADDLMLIINAVPWQCLGEKNYQMRNEDHLYVVRSVELPSITMTSSRNKPDRDTSSSIPNNAFY